MRNNRTQGDTMILETKIRIDFDIPEKKIINDFLDLFSHFEYEDGCSHLSCYNCPFEKLCENELKDAESLIDYLNNNFDT